MKALLKYIWLIGLIFCFSCSDEDSLNIEIRDLNTFTFPQGTNSWDKEIEQIAEDWGMYIIYKDVDSTRLNQVWTMPDFRGPVYVCDEPSDEQIQKYLEIVTDGLLSTLDKNRESDRKQLPVYLYLVNNFRDNNPVSSTYGKTVQVKIDGFNYWSLSFTDEEWKQEISSWDEDVLYAAITYTSVNGESKTLELNEDLLLYHPYYLVEDDVDVSKPVTLIRRGKIEGCDDILDFDPIVLSPEDRVFTADFKKLVKTKYGLSDITKDFINTTEVLEYDYSISSLEDVLNFPNLKKVVLGANRFLDDRYLLYTKSSSTLYDGAARSTFALKMIYDILGVEILHYNTHYYVPSPSYYGFTDITMGNPVVPDKDYLPADTWNWVCSESDEGWDPHLEHLFDGNLETVWEPSQQSTARTYEIEIDMKEVQTVHGIRIAQISYNPATDRNSSYFLPKQIKITVSETGGGYENLTWSEENTIGNTSGEITFLDCPSPKQVRYIKIVVNDQPVGSNYGVKLAEISVY